MRRGVVVVLGIQESDDCGLGLVRYSFESTT